MDSPSSFQTHVFCHFSSLVKWCLHFPSQPSYQPESHLSLFFISQPTPPPHQYDLVISPAAFNAYLLIFQKIFLLFCHQYHCVAQILHPSHTNYGNSQLTGFPACPLASHPIHSIYGGDFKAWKCALSCLRSSRVPVGFRKMYCCVPIPAYFSCFLLCILPNVPSLLHLVNFHFFFKAQFNCQHSVKLYYFNLSWLN